MFDFRAILRALVHHDVEFAIVGGLAGVLHGAPIHTQDLDILYSLTSPNPERLLAATRDLGAVFLGDSRNIEPHLSDMISRGHKLLATRHGRIDCLATIEEDTTYEQLASDFDWMEIDGVAVRVLSLPRLIEVKRKLTRPKDQLAVLQLEATLVERSKS